MNVSTPVPLEFDWSRVAAVYADGGVLIANPSPFGGTWAYCYADAAGERLHGTGGSVTPADVNRPWVSNNLTEVLALLMALEGLAYHRTGWSGPVYSDSLNAIRAFRDMKKCPEWIPAPLWNQRSQVLTWLGPLSWTLLGGHPTRAELAAGVRRDGKPVSAHNVWCDARCTEEAAKLKRQLDAGPAENMKAGGVATPPA